MTGHSCGQAGRSGRATAQLRNSVLLFVALELWQPLMAQSQDWLHREISNGVLKVGFHLPNPDRGFYRGTRFDWSGVIDGLEYKGHNYYGPWFTKTDPKVVDFVFDGDDIVAGPCSAITGPVEEFSTDKPLGFDSAKPGESFVKIGVGALQKPDEAAYSPYRLYRILNPGKWIIDPASDSIEFTQELSDPDSGYGYLYTKKIRLMKGKPEMILEHRLKNTGHRAIETSVYDHNFLVLDRESVGPDFLIKVPFTIRAERVQNAELAKIDGNQFTYKRPLAGRETVSAHFSGFAETSADYEFAIENHKAGVGMKVTGNRPLSKANLWSIRSVLAMEPFIDISIEPGKTFTWKYEYTYYVLE